MAASGFTWDYLRDRTTLPLRAAALQLAVKIAEDVPGNIIEFGVANGDSTRVLRGALGDSDKRIFACDSFKGLPEKFENAEVGEFACEPPRIKGVEIVEGYFEDSLTPELARQVGRVALASLDADLYSSTLCALKWLTPLLGTGSLLLFDEFIGENESEKRAFEDWSSETGVRTIKIAEFMRDPSGYGSKVDERSLFQVIAEDVLPVKAKKIPKPSWRSRVLATPPGRLAKSVRDSLRNKS